VVLVGSRAALAQAVAHEEEPRRSRLRTWLEAGASIRPPESL
jgi:exodeoxyribonuclease V alpha subunit